MRVCLIEKVFETLFDDVFLSAVRSISVAYETARFRLLILDWDPADGVTTGSPPTSNRVE